MFVDLWGFQLYCQIQLQCVKKSGPPPCPMHLFETIFLAFFEAFDKTNPKSVF